MHLFKFVVWAAIFLTSCTTTPPVDTPPWIGKMKNACLPEAIAMAQGLTSSGIQAKVLTIRTPQWGHAVCVYMYPPGENKLHVWDSHWKSIRLRAWWNDPHSIAQAWMDWRHDTSLVTTAFFH